MLSKPELSDLTIKSNDGKEIKVQRVMLAARSPVFYSMLYGEFVEASQSEIEINYSSDVVEALVHYMYTDEAPCLSEAKMKPELTKEEYGNLVKTTASLIDASTYYEMSGLCEKAVIFASKMMQKIPITSVFWLALCDDNPSLTALFERSAYDKICENPQWLLEGDGTLVGTLSSSQIERILKCDNIRGDEFMMFKILQAFTNSITDDAAVGDRTVQAKEFIKHIDLSNIAAADLSTTVASSGLVSTDQLLEAYKQQALQATQQGFSVRKRRRKADVWKSSNCITFKFPANKMTTEALECEPLRPGNVYKWSIFIAELKSQESYLVLGVAPTEHANNYNEYVYGICSHGHPRTPDVFSSLVSDNLKICSGSTVQFTLDLSEAGSLVVAVDDKPSVTIITMDTLRLSYVADCPSFIPVISFNTTYHDNKCTVRFLGFD